MGRCTVRVELHDAPRDAYTDLHEAMRLQGFFSIIKGDDGIWYQMPPAEYITHSDDRAEVWRAATIATGKLPYQAAIFVTGPTDGWIWSGLKPLPYNLQDANPFLSFLASR